MRPYISLYIDGQEIEFQEPPEILMTYAHTDLHNPTVVKNSFSKTVTVDGTARNNRIFGCFGNMNRVLEYADGKYTGAYFNPSRKVDFIILRNGEPIERGYVKLDRVIKKGNQLKFEITLFGGLGQMLFALTYGNDGEQLKLSSLEYDFDLDLAVNHTVVRDAWNYINGIWTADDYDYDATVYDFINFAPCYNGIPEDFSADKVAIQADMFADAWGDTAISGYTSVNGWILGELAKEYDEWQTKDLRSTLMRPVIRFKEIINACCKPENNGGYEVDLDTEFFNESNPYWQNAWMTLPLVKEMEVEQEEDGSSITIETSGDTITVAGGEEGQTVTFTFNIGIGANVNSTRKYLSTNRIMQSWDGSDESAPSDESTNVARYVQVIAYDASDKAIGASAVYSFYTENFMSDDFYYSPEYQANVSKVNGRYVLQSDGTYLFGDKHYDFVIKNLPYTEGMYFKIVEKFALSQAGYVSPNKNELYYTEYYDDDEGGSTSTSAYTITSFYNEVATNTNIGTVTRIERRLTKKTTLNSEGTPCDYFLNYLKMFNLYIWSDNIDKKVYVRLRKNYFTGDKIDLCSFVDRGDEISITPITFDAKYYIFKNEVNADSYLGKVYKDNYGFDYGIQKINTNYNFDNSSKNLIEHNVFSTAICQRGKSRYYTNVFSSEFSDNIPFPSCLIDGVQIFLFKGDDTIEGKYVTPKTTANAVNWYDTKYMDLFPKPDFRDKDGKGIDGANVLLFYNGKQEAKDVEGNYIQYQLSDDIPEFEELNEGEPCWIIAGLSDYTLSINNLPVFSRYLTNENGWVTHSWDFGTPRETYIEGWTIDNTSDIYTQYWKSYMNDELDVNTREVDLKVWFRNKVNPDILQNFIYFDGCYWIIREIIDYDCTSQRPTKVKMVKVNDIKNYMS